MPQVPNPTPLPPLVISQLTFPNPQSSSQKLDVLRSTAPRGLPTPPRRRPRPSSAAPLPEVRLFCSATATATLPRHGSAATPCHGVGCQTPPRRGQRASLPWPRAASPHSHPMCRVCRAGPMRGAGPRVTPSSPRSTAATQNVIKNTCSIDHEC
jgi:hypothetical protein